MPEARHALDALEAGARSSLQRVHNVSSGSDSESESDSEGDSDSDSRDSVSTLAS